MKALLAGALSFAFFSALPSGALSFALYLNRQSVPEATGDLLLALYLIGFTAALTAAGFVIPIALDRRWHGLAWRRAAVIAGALGLLAPVARLGAAAATGSALRPLFHEAPTAAMAILHVVPGLVLGVVAVVLARAVRPAERLPET